MFVTTTKRARVGKNENSRWWSYRSTEQVQSLQGKVGHDVQVLVFSQEVHLLRRVRENRGRGSVFEQFRGWSQRV
jgi:hypothetical protein